MDLMPALDSVAAWLAACRRPLIVTHRRPDGDALGSAAGLARGLASGGAAASVALFEPLPARYQLLESATNWVCTEQQRVALQQSCDALILLDTCAFAQLEPIADWIPAAPRTLVIDHHVTRDPIATRPSDLRLIDPAASATALLVAELLDQTGRPPDRDAAVALFVGIATDTGWFRFSNTDPRTLRCAARLIEAGVEPASLYDRVYQQDPAPKLRLIGRLLTHLELRCGGALAVLRLRQADLAAVGADQGMTEDLVQEANRAAGVFVTVLFSEDADGRIRINLRSKHTVDVSAIAQRFGGGGHVRAAGARVEGEFEAVVAKVLLVVEQGIRAAT